MRMMCGILFLAGIAGCAGPPPDARPAVPPPARALTPPAAAALPETGTLAATASPAARPVATARTLSGIVFEGIAFDSRTHRLMVVDQARGPGSIHPDAGSAARSVGGIAAINAGFFTPEGEPLGLVISSGNQSGAWNRASSLCSGVWQEDHSGRATILRREALGAGRTGGVRELLQAGPMLIADGRPVTGLDPVKPAVRSVLLWDGGDRWWMGRTSPCTLAEISSVLSSASPAGWKVRHALNLDGGRSSELWAGGSLTGGPLTRRPPWNRPVRNFLVLKSR